MCLNIGTPKPINFPFGTNGKLMGFGVPILKHFKVKLKLKPSLKALLEGNNFPGRQTGSKESCTPL